MKILQPICHNAILAEYICDTTNSTKCGVHEID